MIFILSADITHNHPEGEKGAMCIAAAIFLARNGKCENAEYILRSAAAKEKWISRGRNDCVICLDCGMDNETKRICQKICRDYGFAKLLTKQEFLKMIK